MTNLNCATLLQKHVVLIKESSQEAPHLDKASKRSSCQSRQVDLDLSCVIGVVFFINKLLDYLSSHFDY
jgi:hypothetical protein